MSNPRELRTLVDAIAYIVVLRREIKKLRRMNTRLVKAKGVVVLKEIIKCPKPSKN